MEYNLRKLVSVFLNAVDNLIEIVELAGRFYVPTQVVDLPYTIVITHCVQFRCPPLAP